MGNISTKIFLAVWTSLYVSRVVAYMNAPKHWSLLLNLNNKGSGDKHMALILSGLLRYLLVDQIFVISIRFHPKDEP